jgi:hypothetical protein
MFLEVGINANNVMNLFLNNVNVAIEDNVLQPCVSAGLKCTTLCLITKI